MARWRCLGRQRPQLLEPRRRAPSVTPTVFTQAVGHPRDILRSNNKVGSRPPETGEIVRAVCLARLTNAHHGTGTFGAQMASTSPTAKAACFSSGHGTRHTSIISAYDLKCNSHNILAVGAGPVTVATPPRAAARHTPRLTSMASASVTQPAPRLPHLRFKPREVGFGLRQIRLQRWFRIGAQRDVHAPRVDGFVWTSETFQ